MPLLIFFAALSTYTNDVFNIELLEDLDDQHFRYLKNHVID